MKKHSLLLFLLIIFFQTPASLQPHFGMDIGFSIAKGSYSPGGIFERRVMGGFDGGFLVEFPLSKLALQPELNFTIDGVELNDGNKENTYKLYYFTIPILVKWKFSKNFSILGGPAHGILITAWNDISGGGPSQYIKGTFKFSDLLGVLGLEYRINKGLFFSARYNHGYEQIVEEGLGFEMKNRFWSFRFGYLFNNKRK